MNRMTHTLAGILAVLGLAHCGATPETLNSTGAVVATDTGTSGTTGGGSTSGGTTGGQSGSSSSGSSTGSDPVTCHVQSDGSFAPDAGETCCSGLVQVEIEDTTPPTLQCFEKCESNRDCPSQDTCATNLPKTWTAPPDAGSLCI